MHFSKEKYNIPHYYHISQKNFLNKTVLISESLCVEKVARSQRVYDYEQFDFGFKVRYAVIDILAGNFSILFGRKRSKFFNKSAEKLVTLNKICLNCAKKFDK